MTASIALMMVRTLAHYGHYEIINNRQCWLSLRLSTSARFRIR